MALGAASKAAMEELQAQVDTERAASEALKEVGCGGGGAGRCLRRRLQGLAPAAVRAKQDAGCSGMWWYVEPP